MNKEELIQSGLLELYALNHCTESERTLVESHLQDEDVITELNAIEETLFSFALNNSVKPRQEMKAKIMASIEGGKETPKTKTISKPKTSNKDTKVVGIGKNTNNFGWRVAAGFMLLVSIGLFTVYNGRLNQMDERIMALTIEKESISKNYSQVKAVSEELSEVEHFFSKRLIRSYELKHPTDPSKTFGVLYWCPTSGEIMLNGMHMPKLSDDEQYQLWALVDGNPLDLGVIPKDWDGGTNRLAHLKGLKELSAYAITIEPLGGNPTPTLEKLTALAKV
jgi:anti-sigma-K factor RskA